jgi:hypothetical protein
LHGCQERRDSFGNGFLHLIGEVEALQGRDEGVFHGGTREKKISRKVQGCSGKIEGVQWVKGGRWIEVTFATNAIGSRDQWESRVKGFIGTMSEEPASRVVSIIYA